jgi:hypothetical protein
MKFLLLPGFIFSFILLLLYSYTQIDLNLFLSKYEPILSFQRFFQNIGYFQRPLSTYLYLGIIGLLFAFYFYALDLARKNKLNLKEVWKIVLIGGALLTFAYNAFSYDLFNYIFDAKIVTYYQQNPYDHKALDYTGDPMLNFMRWTHRTYPYGPSWLGLTVPLSFFGMNFFLPTAILFKALATASYLGTVWFISKILNKIDPKNLVFGVVFFALNPLVIVESLASAHLDIAMMFFGALAFYLLISKKFINSFFSLLFSIGIKFATGFLLPVFVWVWYKKGLIAWDRIVKYSIILMSLSVVAATLRTNFQPWYLLSVLPFAALLSKKYYVFIPSAILSFTSLLIYVPYLSSGNWDPPIPQQLFFITTGGIFVSVVLVSFKALLGGKIKL